MSARVHIHTHHTHTPANTHRYRHRCTHNNSTQYLQLFAEYCAYMQGYSLHFIISRAEPLQFFPPQDVEGLLHFLVLSLTQDCEQFPTDQSDHPPSTV